MMKKLPPLIIIILFVFSCVKSNIHPVNINNINYSPPIQYGLGYARSFIQTTDSNQLISIGVQMTATALTGLPDSIIGSNGTVEVPKPETDSISGIDHIRIQWHPSQYDSIVVHDSAYFDIYFFLVAKKELDNIKAGQDSTAVDSQYIPSDYISTYTSIAQTGVSWEDSTIANEKDSTFNSAFDYGFYQGKMIFLKAVINNAFLRSNTDHLIEIKQPAAFQRQAYYPMRLHIQYSAGKEVYNISLEGLQEH